MSRSKEIADLIRRSKARSLTLTEAAQLQAWRDASPDNEALFALWQDDARVAALLGEQYALEAACWERICRQTGLSIPAAAPVVSLWVRYKNVWMTAIHLGLAGLAVWFLWYMVKPVHAPPAPVAQVHTQTQATKHGQRDTVLLPDGSTVYLNALSRLQYPDRFDTARREVWLQGEAEFSVVKKQGIPFKVFITGHSFSRDTVTIEVLGTRFNVKAYAEEQKVLTTVVDGTVKVQAGKATDTLHPGQQNRVDSAGLSGAYTVTPYNVLAWTRDSLNGDKGITVGDLVQALQRWNDLPIICHGNAGLIVYGNFSRKAGVEKSLRLLQTTGNLTYAMHKDSIVVTIK
jgi:ferric-dicitrate binding protein FerR (iron transport regulator)